MAELQLPKLIARVRFPSLAPVVASQAGGAFVNLVGLRRTRMAHRQPSKAVLANRPIAQSPLRDEARLGVPRRAHRGLGGELQRSHLASCRGPGTVQAKLHFREAHFVVGPDPQRARGARRRLARRHRDPRVCPVLVKARSNAHRAPTLDDLHRVPRQQPSTRGATRDAFGSGRTRRLRRTRTW